MKATTACKVGLALVWICLAAGESFAEETTVLSPLVSYQYLASPDAATPISPLVSYQYLAMPDATTPLSPLVSYQYLSGPDGFFGTSPIVSYEFNNTLPIDDASLVSQSPALDAVMNSRQSFSATLRLRNIGTTTWQPGTEGHTLNFVAGQLMGAAAKYLTLASPVAPGGEATFTLALTAPMAPGKYTGNWRMNSPAGSGTGQCFGQTVSIRIVVPMPAGDPPEYTPTGFVYPTGHADAHNGMAGWLDGGPAMPPYLTGYYHLGVDMAGSAGAPVYAISDGDIVYVSTGGWGAGNYGLLVRHPSTDGQEFLALYGHVRPLNSSLRLSSPGAVVPAVPVRAAEVFASIGPADGYSPAHVHFGVRPSNALPPAPFGKMPLGNWPQTNSFVDPLDWLGTHAPQNALAPTSPGAPRNLTVAAASTVEVQVKWQAGEGAADGYRIERKVGTSGSWTEIAVVPSPTTSYCDEGLTANTTYSYRMRAYNGAGPSPYCTVAAVTTPQASLQPQIDRVEPTSPLATGAPQSFSIIGKNFLPDSIVSLQPPNSTAFSPATYTGRSQGVITFDIVFDGSQMGEWSVEVINSGGERAARYFTVGTQSPQTEVEINENRFLDNFRTTYGDVSLWQVAGLDETRNYTSSIPASNLQVSTLDQKEGIKQLLRAVNADTDLEGLHDVQHPRHLQHLRWAAYILATARHETARAWGPVQEQWSGTDPWYYFEYLAGGSGYGGRVDLGNAPKGEGDGFRYRGRGYVQITGRTNYQSLGSAAGTDLEYDPNSALGSDAAYNIMSHGMRNGSFTGRALGDYILADGSDGGVGGGPAGYLGARAIVNGTDNAQAIADSAVELETVLRASLTDKHVGNGAFASGKLAGWSFWGSGQASTAQTTPSTFSAILTSHSPAILYQTVNTPAGYFELSFDYHFLTTNGTLDVLLDSVVLASINAPETIAGVPTRFALTVTDPALFSLNSAALAFRYDGPADTQIQLSNVSLAAVTGVQEAAVLCLSPANRNHGSDASSGQQIALTANTAWMVAVDQGWVTLTSATSGSGNTTITYNLAANGSSSARIATITVTAGEIERTFLVRQLGQGCDSADLSGDGVVDSLDFAAFEACASGPAIPHDGSAGCQQADFDDDGDVDQSDFGALQRCLSGESAPVGVGCAE